MGVMRLSFPEDSVRLSVTASGRAGLYALKRRLWRSWIAVITSRIRYNG